MPGKRERHSLDKNVAVIEAEKKPDLLACSEFIFL
jgi:hypothetical protein